MAVIVMARDHSVVPRVGSDAMAWVK